MSTGSLGLLLLLFPAAGAILLAGRGWRLPRIFTVIVGPGVVWASFVCVLALFFGQASGDFTYWTWIKSGTFDVPFNLLIDNLSIFMFSMLLLVLAGNFIFLITGWALVGLSSYLLIGFWYQRRSAVVAARKAFVMNVIGDVGMILGAFVLFITSHHTTYTGVFAAATNWCPPNHFCDKAFHSDNAMLELAAFLLLVGAVAT